MCIAECTFLISLVPIYNEPSQPCNPSPCGSNAICKERNGVGSCRCIENYFGDPYIGCKPECVTSSDCPSNKACYQNKCKDVCNGACASNAHCIGVNHVPMCYCLDGYTGDARTNCYEIPKQCKNHRNIHFANNDSKMMRIMDNSWFSKKKATILTTALKISLCKLNFTEFIINFV